MPPGYSDAVKRSDQKPQSIGVAELKARCTGIIKRVARSRQAYVVTVRGKPVAELTPLRVLKPKEVQFGGMKGTAEIVGDIISPSADDWYADDRVNDRVYERP